MRMKYIERERQNELPVNFFFTSLTGFIKLICNYLIIIKYLGDFVAHKQD